MQYQDKQDIFAHINKIVRTRKLVIFLCVAAVLCPVIYYNQTTTPTYEASVSLIFEDLASPTPEFTTEASLDLILNRIEEIKSRSFTEDIVKTLPEGSLDRFPVPDDAGQNFDKLGAFTSEIHKNINAFLLRNSNIIMITIQMQNPQLCMDIANSAAQVLKERDFRVKKAGLSSLRQFIEDQLSIVQEKLDLSEKTLLKFKENNGIMSFDMESEEIQKKLTQAEILYNVAQSEKSAVEERLATIKRKYSARRKDLVPSIATITSPRVQKLKEKLIEVELQSLELKVQNYAEDHPKMIQLSQEIAQTRESLRNETLQLTNNEKLIDPLVQMEKYANESITLELDLESFKAQEVALKGIIDEYDNALNTLPRKEYQLAQLTRDKEVNQKIYMMLSEKLEEAKISEAENITEIRIIDKAELPKFPILPNKKLNLAIGLILGLIVGVGLAFLLEYKDIIVTSPEEVEHLVKWPLLGIIPNIDMDSNGKSKAIQNKHLKQLSKNSFAKRGLVSLLQPKSSAAEAFKMLRTNLIFKGIRDGHKTLLITSVSPSNGKSTTAANLAISFATLGKKTLLIDADFRMSSLHSVFGLEREPGLGDILDDANALRNRLASLVSQNKFSGFSIENSRPSAVKSQFLENDMVEDYTFLVGKMERIKFLNKTAIRKTNIENLSFIANGKKLINPSENVSSRSIELLLEELKSKFDIVIIDSPPLTLVPDTMVLSTMVDGALFVVDANQYDKEMLIRAKNLSENADITVFGVVMNNLKNKQAIQKYSAYYGD